MSFKIKFLVLVFAGVFPMLLLQGCAEIYLTSQRITPSTPHLVFKTGDTLYADSVQLRARFMAKARFIADGVQYPHDTIRYAYTSNDQKLAMTTWGMVQQSVQGPINIYGNVKRFGVLPSSIVDTGGYYPVVKPELRYIQQSPGGVMQPYSHYMLQSMVSDNPVSLDYLRKERSAHAMMVGSLITGGALVVAGFATVLVAALSYSSNSVDRTLMYGLGSMLTGAVTVGVGLPVFRREKIHNRYKAIEVYNTGRDE